MRTVTRAEIEYCPKHFAELRAAILSAQSGLVSRSLFESSWHARSPEGHTYTVRLDSVPFGPCPK